MTLGVYKDRNALILIKSFLVFFGFMMLSFFLSDIISESVLDGFKFALNVILPTLFPFMIFSDIASRHLSFEKSRFFSCAFERTFKINRVGISAFLSGMVGGFPVGARNALMLCEDGKISKCECERLMSFANIPSPAYVVCAIGLTILSSFKLGIALYLSVVLSSVFTGIIIGKNKSFSSFTELNKRQKYSFVSSVKSSANAALNAVFFISFFFAISEFIRQLPIKSIFKALIISLIEITASVAYISDLCILSLRIRIAIIAFSLSFSGISVISQSLAISKKCDVSLQKIIIYKLLQGVISFIIILVLPIHF